MLWNGPCFILGMGSKYLIILAIMIANIVPVIGALANESTPTPPQAPLSYRDDKVAALEAANKRHRSEMKYINEAGLSEGNPREQIRRLKWLQQEISLNENAIKRMKLGNLTAKELVEELLFGMQKAGKGLKSGFKGKLLGAAVIMSSGSEIKSLVDQASAQGSLENDDYASRGSESNGLLDKIRLQGSAR